MRRLFGGGVAVLCTLVLGMVGSASAANITFVSFHDSDAPSQAAADAGLTEASDIGYTDMLTGAGHTVTRFLTHEPLTADDISQLNASDLVIISRAVNSGHYDPPTDWNTQVTAPTIAMSGYILRSSRLNFTNGTTMQDTVAATKLVANDPGHPVFAGIALDGNDEMVNPFVDIVVANGATQRGTSINMNDLVGGTAIGTITDDGTATAGGVAIAEWPAGAVLNNGDVLAGPRMAFLSGSREVDGVTSETAGFIDLSADGAAMFLNAVEYMAVPEPSAGLLALMGFACVALLRRRR